MSDNQKVKQVNKQKMNSKDHPKKMKNNSDAEPRQRETGGGSGGCRAMEAAGDFSKTKRNRGENQTVPTRQHEVLSNALRGGNSERNERSQNGKRKQTEDNTQTEQTTAHSPLILQGCNSHILASAPPPANPPGHVCFPSILPREAYIDHSMLKCDLKNKQTVGYFKGETSDSQILLLLLHFLHRCFTLKAFQPLKGQTPT